MGFHQDVQTGLALKLETAMPTVPILNGLVTTEDEINRHAVCVLVVREVIEYDPHETINPTPTETQQPEEWRWSLEVKGGGGAELASKAGAEVDFLLEKIRTALAAQRLTTDCGPLNMVTEEYVGQSGRGVVYRQTWTHERF